MAFQGARRRLARGPATACLLAALCLALRSSLLFVTPLADLSAATRSAGAAETAELGGVRPAAASAASSSCGASAVLASAAVASIALIGLRARSGSLPSSAQRRTALQARGGGKAPLVVIAGPPAAGKGTQCDKIKAQFGYVHISTGDILRDNVKNGTELGMKAKQYMDSGALVPSELIVDLVKDRLNQPDVKEKGCLLDGFPRAPDQAKALVDAGVQVQKFLLIKVPDDTLVERGVGRRLDPQTGEIYHLKFKPPPADIVDRLVHRSDDQEDKIRARLQAYHSQIDGILPFFKDVVYEIDGTSKPDDVFQSVQKGLANL